MKAYEVTCTSLALVKVAVQAESKGEADVDLDALPTSLRVGNLLITFEDWTPEAVADVTP